ncbi:MAG: hypothetical protein M1608_06205, partial [Candidatus Omnitrophica bacterium]|nr:hypothetical protein [Candidatus Omnitrophota bacterium]
EDGRGKASCAHRRKCLMRAGVCILAGAKAMSFAEVKNLLGVDNYLRLRDDLSGAAAQTPNPNS